MKSLELENQMVNAVLHKKLPWINMLEMLCYTAEIQGE